VRRIAASWEGSLNGCTTGCRSAPVGSWAGDSLDGAHYPARARGFPAETANMTLASTTSIKRSQVADCAALTPMFSSQFKSRGSDNTVRYGGMRGGQWRSYEISWLRSVMTPLFLARTEQNPSTLTLYSMGPIWRLLWQSTEPFETIGEAQPISTEATDIGTASRVDSTGPYGDKSVWTVPLGLHCEWCRVRSFPRLRPQ